MKKSLSPYAKYGKSDYAKTLYEWGRRNPNKINKINEYFYTYRYLYFLGNIRYIIFIFNQRFK